MEQQFTVEELQKILDTLSPQTESPELAEGTEEVVAEPEIVVEPEVPLMEEAPAEEPIEAEPEIAVEPEVAVEEAVAEPEIAVEPEVAVEEVAAEPEMVVEPEMPVMEEAPVVVDEAVEVEPEAAAEEVVAEPEMPVMEENPIEEAVAEEPVVAEPEIATQTAANLVIMKKISGKPAFCVEVDGILLGEEAETKYLVLITGNNIVYVKGNCLISQNIGTGETRNDEMDEMILYAITNGMMENVEANRWYSTNSLLLKWLLAKLLYIREGEKIISELNEYFDFIQLGISVVCEEGNISFKEASGETLLIADVFEKLSIIRA